MEKLELQNFYEIHACPYVTNGTESAALKSQDVTVERIAACIRFKAKESVGFLHLKAL